MSPTQLPPKLKLSISTSYQMVLIILISRVKCAASLADKAVVGISAAFVHLSGFVFW